MHLGLNCLPGPTLLCHLPCVSIAVYASVSRKNATIGLFDGNSSWNDNNKNIISSSIFEVPSPANSTSKYAELTLVLAIIIVIIINNGSWCQPMGTNKLLQLSNVHGHLLSHELLATFSRAAYICLLHKVQNQRLRQHLFQLDIHIAPLQANPIRGNSLWLYGGGDCAHLEATTDSSLAHIWLIKCWYLVESIRRQAASLYYKVGVF